MLKPKKYNSGCMVLSPLFYKKGIMACAFSLLFGAGIFLPAHFSYAADIAWTGTTSSDWALATNWSTGVIPTAADNVTIPDATTTANDPSVASGAVCSNLTIALGGLLNGNAQTISVYGNWTNAGTFQHGSGKIIFLGYDEKTFTPGSSQYFDLELNRNSIFMVSGSAVVVGDYTHTRGQMRNGQFDVAGDYIIGPLAGGAAYSSTVINLNSTADQSIVYAAGGSGAQVRIDKAGGTLTVASDIVVNGWNYIRGTVAGLDTHTLIFGDDEYGTFTPGTFTYNNIELRKTGTDMLITSGVAHIAGNFTHTDGQMREGQFDLTGNYIIGALANGATYGSTIINFNSTSDQQVISNAGGVGARIRIDKTAGNFTISDDVVINGWVYAQGAVVGLDTHTLIFGDDEYGEFVPGALVYSNIELRKTGTDSLITTGTAIISGNFIHSDGQLRYGQFDVAGNYVIGAEANGATYTSTIVNLNSSADQSIIYTAGGSGGWVRVDKPAGTLGVDSDITVSGWSHIRGTVVGINTHTLTFGDDEYGEFVPGSLTYGNIIVNKTVTDDLFVGAGTLNISGNLTVTDGELYFNNHNPTVNVSGSVSIAAAGSLYSGSNPITVNGSWTNSGTFSHGNGKIIFGGITNAVFTPGSPAYNNIELNKTAASSSSFAVTVSGTATVSGSVTQLDGRFSGGQINLAGNYTVGAAAHGGTAVINFNHVSNNQAIIYNASGVGAQISIDKAGGNFTVSDNILINGWTYVKGAVVGTDTHTLIFVGAESGSFTPGILAYSGIELNKTAASSSSDILTVSGIATVSGNLTQTNGRFSGGQINLAGDYVIGAAASGGTAAINFNHAGNDQAIIYNASGIGANIRIEKTAGNFTLSGNIAVNGWEYISGAVIGASDHFIVFSGENNGNFIPGALAYGDIEINKTHASIVTDDLIVGSGVLNLSGDLIVTDGELRFNANNTTVNIGGDLSISAVAIFTRGTGVLTFNGTNPSIFNDASSAPQNIGKVSLDKTNPDESQNKLTLASSLTCNTLVVDGAAGASDTLDLGSGGYTLTLANAGSVPDILDLNGTIFSGDGTVKYAATNSAGSINIAPTTYDSMQLSGNETYVLTNDTSIGGNLTIGSVSTLNTATYDLILSGNLNNSGIFVAGSNAVTLTGINQSLSGNTTFYDFTKTITAADALTFQFSSVTTVNHALTLKGESRTNRLTLQSNVPDSSWSLAVDALGTYDFDSLAVSDSVANRTLSALNSLDQGGNSNWTLINNTAPTSTTPTIISSGSIATITATLSDNDADNLRLKIEYSLDGGATWLDPDLDSLTASSGSPVLTNASEYQVSNVPSAVANTLTILWDTTSELNQGGYIGYSDNVKVRLSPYDNSDYGANQVSNAFTVDNCSSGFIAPAKPNLSDLKIMHEGGVLSFEHLPESIQQVAVSASPDFTDASFQELSAVIDINGYASDTLYLKLRTKRGAVSDVIVYNRNSGATAQLLDEGDIVKTASSFDVYIIKYKNGKQYKRLILSPSVFSSYQHLKWDNLKTISPSQLDNYTTSDLVQVAGDVGLYELTPRGDTGRRRPVDSTESYDRDSVYEINETDRDNYTMNK